METAIKYLVDLGLLTGHDVGKLVLRDSGSLLNGFVQRDHAELAQFATDAAMLLVALENSFVSNFEEGEAYARYKAARVSADKKLAKDPKQIAKQGAEQLWREWRLGQLPKKIKTTEQFAIEVMRRWPVLKSAKNIGAWSAKWGKAAEKRRKANPVS